MRVGILQKDHNSVVVLKACVFRYKVNSFCSTLMYLHSLEWKFIQLKVWILSYKRLSIECWPSNIIQIFCLWLTEKIQYTLFLNSSVLKLSLGKDLEHWTLTQSIMFEVLVLKFIPVLYFPLSIKLNLTQCCFLQ